MQEKLTKAELLALWGGKDVSLSRTMVFVQVSELLGRPFKRCGSCPLNTSCPFSVTIDASRPAWVFLALNLKTLGTLWKHFVSARAHAHSCIVWDRHVCVCLCVYDAT